jgi:hypothetical protein
MAISIDRNLNVVLRIRDEEGNPLIVHSTPLPTALVESNWKIFREAYDEIRAIRNFDASAVVAKRIFLDAADEIGKKADAIAILESIISATFVYTTAPSLLKAADISNEMKDEVLSRLIFFMCFKQHVFPSAWKDFSSKMLPALNVELTSSTATEIFGSTTTSTTEEPIANTDTSFPT